MRSRIVLPLFAAMLMIGALASAEAPQQAVAPTAPSGSAGDGDALPAFLLAPAGSACQASPVKAQLPDVLHPFAPQPAALTCGSCSSDGCAGARPNTSCEYVSGGSYHLAQCQVESTCSTGGFLCVCASEAP
jgi:hypothetical protein